MGVSITVTSVWYLLLIVVGVVVYYILPKRIQWTALLLMSLIFYRFAATWYTFAFLIFSTAVAYTATLLMERFAQKGRQKAGKIVLCVSLVLNILPWLLTSASDLWISGTRHLGRIIPFVHELRPLPVAAAMGMGYYTSQVIAYIIDCHWQTTERQKNPLKLLAFVCFFPQLTTGPISRYSNLRSMFEGHSFSYQNLCFGAQRILWGFFKKLVLADRVGVIVNAVWASPDAFSGLWHWVAMLLFPLLVYCDFSGCMDVVLGTAEIFDIRLEENFKNPFFSRSIREFWSRWHITLGKWAKDYVMYPILKSDSMVSLTKKAKKRFGKRTGKFLTSAFASAMVWLVMGVWHGGFKHIIGISVYYWVLVELGELFDPLWDRFYEKTKLDKDRFSWRFFQSVRTYIVYSFGVVFFKADSIREAFSFYRSLFAMRPAFAEGGINPWIFFDGSIINTGITYGGINLILIGILLLIIVGSIREKGIYAREWVAGQGVVFRWMLWILLFLIVLLYGSYGPGYDASEFFYQRF